MDVKRYLDKPYNYIINPVEDECGKYFHATVLEMPGCQSSGDTFAEACDGIREAMEGWIETKLENGFDIPEPKEESCFCGRLNLCIPKSLHQRLAIEAEREGVPLEQYAIYKLSL